MTILTTILWVLAAAVVGAVAVALSLGIFFGFIAALVITGEKLRDFLRARFRRERITPLWMNEDNVAGTLLIFCAVAASVGIGAIVLSSSETHIGWPDVPDWMHTDEG